MCPTLSSVYSGSGNGASFLHGVAKKANTIFTMLPLMLQVKDVYLGDCGILQALNSPSPSSAPESIPPLFVDYTTLDVHFAREVAMKTFMAGGPNEAFEHLHPFLSMMGTRAVHCGPSGTGLVAKLCNNHILVSLLVVWCS